jgi:ubiquitin-protein ligase E3 D
MSLPHQILIYAELLSQIRQVSVGCALPSPSSASTRATISSDGAKLTITHDGIWRSVQLPGRVQAPSQLPILKQGLASLSWRLPLVSSPDVVARPSLENPVIPWSASDLKPLSSIGCRECKAIIVRQKRLLVWKDLPSENWAEMMEFWHCHKPHDHKHEDPEGLATRGYGANSKIVAKAGVGFVDLTSFLISKDDLNGSSVSFPLILCCYLVHNIHKIWVYRRWPNLYPSRILAQWCGHRYSYPRSTYTSIIDKW